MKAPTTDHLPSAPEREAWRWLLRRQARDAGGDERAFRRWLAADPQHPAAYLQAEAVWLLSATPASRVAQKEAAALQGYLARMDAPARRGSARRGPAWSLALAASLLLALWTGGWWQPGRWLDGLRADHVSAPGEIRELSLADGSQLVLDGDSALAVHFDAGLRQIELLRGAAAFKVVRNGRPFVVRAADGEARVLGTEFEVRRLEHETRVTVASGQVAVRAGEAPDMPRAVLQAGQRVAFADGRLEAPETVDSAAALAWRQGWLSFYHAPLGEVLERLGDYYPGRILLLDGELAARRVTLSFPSDEPLAALDSLQAVLGFQRRELFGRVILIH